MNTKCSLGFQTLKAQNLQFRHGSAVAKARGKTTIKITVRWEQLF